MKRWELIRREALARMEIAIAETEAGVGFTTLELEAVEKLKEEWERAASSEDVFHVLGKTFAFAAHMRRKAKKEHDDAKSGKYSNEPGQAARSERVVRNRVRM